MTGSIPSKLSLRIVFGMGFNGQDLEAGDIIIFLTPSCDTGVKWDKLDEHLFYDMPHNPWLALEQRSHILIM